MTRARSIAIGLACAFVAGTIVVPIAASGAVAPKIARATEIDDAVEKAEKDLDAAKEALNAAETRLKNANDKLPGAEREVAASDVESARAAQAVIAANSAVDQAQAQVAAKQKEVAKAKAEVAAMREEIAVLARKAYMEGGVYEQLEVLLNSQDPGQFALQLAALKATARGNTQVLDQVSALKTAMSAQLEQLRALEAQTQQASEDAAARSAEANQAEANARAAKQQVTDLVAERESSLKTATENRAALKTVYLQQLERQREEARQRDLAAGRTNIPWAGQEEAAKVAVEFAKSQIGHPYTSAGGTGPAYGCNGFSWRVWHEAGSGWPLLMAQDQSTSSYVQRVPKSEVHAGDVIFFVVGNGTDWRPGAIDHVGIVVDPATGTFVHAANTLRGVVTNSYLTDSAYQHPAAFARVMR